MRQYLLFLGLGLLLGLFLEVELKLVAGLKPEGFIITLFVYPILVTLFYLESRIIDKWMTSRWRGDILHYLTVGVFGLAFEWILLGNGPASNAFQLGMFGMWTTWGFGPRILTRQTKHTSYRTFWRAFFISAVLLTALILLAPSPQAKTVISVLGLSGTYIIWSIWLLVLGRKSSRQAS